MKRQCIIIQIIFCVLIMSMCTQNDMGYVGDKAKEYRSKQIVLGDKLENPYTLDNMQRALDTLLRLKGVDESIELEPTDYYVRFQPTDTTEYRALVEQEFELFDYPLDYEIVEGGDSYHDPSIPEDQITWQYTVIPKESLIQTIKFDKIYELKKIDGDVVIKDKSGILMRGSIIDNCFIPREDLKSKSFPVSSEELENMAIRLTQPKENHNNGEPELLSSGGYPHGSIKVINDKGAAVGVPGVKVRARYFLKWKHAYTNADGYFSFSSKFSKDPCMSIVFENSKGFTVWGNWAFLAAAHHTIGKKSPSQNLIYVKSRSEGRNYWDWSVISRSSYDYYTSCSDASGLFYGVQAPPSNMKIWCIGDASEMASTPMARHLKVAKTLSAEATMIAFCTNCLALKVASGIISFALHIALPDMFIGTKGMTYNELYLRMFHEFSHASHFQQIGEWKWGDVIWYEMRHNGYGKTRDNSRGEDYVELTESYSYAMENFVENELFYPISTDYSFRGDSAFFKVSTWHLSNLLIEDVIATSSMSKAMNNASHINDLHKNLYMYNGGKTPKLNEEFRKKWEDRGK